MKTFSLILLMAICAATSFAQNPSREVVKIGLIIPLTSGLARRGDDVSKFVEILQPRLNKKSTKFEYKFLVDDGECGNGDAPTTAAVKFINIDKVKFLITACSGETLQVGPLAERNKVIDFAITSTHKDIKHLGEYVFRTYLDIERIIPGFSDHIAKESENRVAVLTEENAFTFGTRDLLLQTLGDKVVYADDFPLDSHDFNTLLAKVRAKGAKGIYLNVMSEGTLSTLVNQARALKLDQKLYSYNMPEASSFRKVTGKNSDGLEFIGTPVVVNASEEFKEALNAFWKIHPEGPSYEFGLRTAFDAIKSITDGVEAVGPDPTKVKEFLKSYESDGALGKISYDENGDIANINYVLKRVMEDGTNKVVGQLAK